jgi:hypothetical protein
MEKIIHHIRKIRRQPEHVKRNILHITITACGVVLAMLWVYSLGTTLANEDIQPKIDNGLKPFSALKDNFVNGYNTLSTPDTDGQTQ